jgi:hypothetical protein
MPASYGIHPIINIAHLEKYQPSPTKFGNRPTKNLNCYESLNANLRLVLLTRVSKCLRDP